MRLPSPLPPAWKIWLFAFTAVALIVGLAAAGGAIAERRETRQQTQQLQTDLLLRRELLRSELERHRLLPALLAEDTALADAVAPGRGSRRADADGRSASHGRLNERFAELALRDGAATLYLIGADGITVAASNHGSRGSFVGQDYSFRPYFRDAMARGQGEFFAQGTVSGIPGLYLAQRLVGGGGVVVVKVEFARLERNWRSVDDRTFVVDGRGTVLVTSDPALRFSREPGATGRRLLRVTAAAAYPGWTLVGTRDVSGAVLGARASGWITGGLAGGLFCLGLGLFWVTRSRAEARVQRLRSDLVQANRLAVLGQISAGVAHEINQPVAAIRGYVDNAAALLQRGDDDAVRRNLSAVAGLTERIGLITNELRLFSRKTPAAAEPVAVADAIGGALLLLDALIKSQRVRLLREGPADTTTVIAHRVRLEQVLVNLLQNALEALQDRPDPVIRIRVQRHAADGATEIRVCDNGPGVPASMLGQLFMPFSTSKPLGLGLGLVICKDLLAEYGATLHHERSDLGGASFTIRFPGSLP